MDSLLLEEPQEARAKIIDMKSICFKFIHSRSRFNVYPVGLHPTEFKVQGFILITNLKSKIALHELYFGTLTQKVLFYCGENILMNFNWILLF